MRNITQRILDLKIRKKKYGSQMKKKSVLLLKISQAFVKTSISAKQEINKWS